MNDVTGFTTYQINLCYVVFADIRYNQPAASFFVWMKTIVGLRRLPNKYHELIANGCGSYGVEVSNSC